MKVCICCSKRTSKIGFVRFWSSCYFNKNEVLYARSIRKPLTSKKLLELFKWKNNGKLSKTKLESVKRNFIARLGEVQGITNKKDARNLLSEFEGGGPIWRIFFFHCCQPNWFPIYDQHVHRAMEYIVNGRTKEIPRNDQEKIGVYLERYIPFYEKLECLGLDKMSADKALWAFGKFIKDRLFLRAFFAEPT